MNSKTLYLPLLLLCTSCATQGDLRTARQDVEELKIRLLKAEKEISTVKVEARDIAVKSSGEALKTVEQLRKGSADTQAALDSMRVDLQIMSGRIDEMGQTAKKPFDDISLLKEDTVKALSTMEERLRKLETAQTQLAAKLEAAVKAAEVPPNPDGIYKQALDVMKSGDTGKAREMLKKFIEQYPEHKLAANCRYWIGETYYMEKSYEQAVLEFQRVIKEYPGKEKVPAAMFKQGLAFKELGDVKSAKFIIRELIEKYPLADEIPAAKEALAKLK